MAALLVNQGWTAALALIGLVAVQVLVSGLVLLRPMRRQSSSMAWILVILTLPGFGILAYLLFGVVRLGKERVQRFAQIRTQTHRALAPTWQDYEAPRLDALYDPVQRLASKACDTEPRGGNGVELLGESARVVERIVADINAATEQCHLIYYIVVDDEHGRLVGQALIEAATRGVSCRLLCDALGSRLFLESELCERMREAGVRVVAALKALKLPLLTARIDLRNHRKICVIDHRIGYTGSQNLASPSFDLKPKYAPWVDCMLRIEGPAVLDLAALFVEDWFLDAREDLSSQLRPPAAVPGGIPLQILGTGPGREGEGLIQLVQAALHLAREEVQLTTPYFVPDEGTLDAITTAAARGVQVRLTVPMRSDSKLVAAASRAYYEPLLDAGVEIYEFREGVLHSKLVTVDRTLALVTTANLDRRSFEINFEASTLVYDSDLASQVRLLQRSYEDASQRVDAERWSQRPLWRRAIQNGAGLLGPLL